MNDDEHNWVSDDSEPLIQVCFVQQQTGNTYTSIVHIIEYHDDNEPRIGDMMSVIEQMLSGNHDEEQTPVKEEEPFEVINIE